MRHEGSLSSFHHIPLRGRCVRHTCLHRAFLIPPRVAGRVLGCRGAPGGPFQEHGIGPEWGWCWEPSTRSRWRSVLEVQRYTS